MKPIYLEPDEEITSVIDKIKDLSDHKVAVVVPKNGTLFQSLINLKLLAKEAKEQGKEVVIVSTNRVGQRLAQQVGFTTYNSLGTVAPEPTKVEPPTAKASVPEAETVIDGVRVNQYNPDIPVTATDEMTEPPAIPETVELVEPAAAEPIEAVEPIETSEPIVPAEVVAEKPKPATIETFFSKPEPVKAEPPAAVPTIPHDHGELPPIIPRSIHVAAPKEPFKMPWRSVAIGSVITVLLLAVVYLSLPKATVTLTLPATAVNPSQDLTVSTNAPTGADNTIAGNLLTSDQSSKSTITATGTKDIGTKATGTVTFYNKASSAAVTLAAGTTLTASSKTFTTDKSVTIPGASVSGGSVVAGQVSGSITASVVGDPSNLANAQFTIANQPALVYAQGSSTGGTTKTVTVLAQSDIDGAVASAKADLTTKATADIKTKAAQQTVLDNSSWLTVTSQTVDQSVGAQVSSANLSMAVEAGEIAFDQNAANNAIKVIANQQVKTGQELIIPDSNSISLVFKSVANDKASIIITASLNGFVVAKIDKVAVAKLVAHHSKASAINLIKSQYQATDVTVNFRPSWWPNQLPLLHQAIQIQYGFHETIPPATTK